MQWHCDNPAEKRRKQVETQHSKVQNKKHKITQIGAQTKEALNVVRVNSSRSQRLILLLSARLQLANAGALQQWRLTGFALL